MRPRLVANNRRNFVGIGVIAQIETQDAVRVLEEIAAVFETEDDVIHVVQMGGETLGRQVREMLATYVRQDLPSTPLVIPKLPTGGSGGLMPGIDPSSNRSMIEALDANIDLIKLR